MTVVSGQSGNEPVPDQTPAGNEIVLAEVVDDGAVPAGVDLLAAARLAASAHRRSTGRDITRDELRAVLRIASATASELLRRLRDEARQPSPERTEPATGTPSRPGPGRAGVVPVAAEAFGRVNTRPAGQVTS